MAMTISGSIRRHRRIAGTLKEQDEQAKEKIPERVYRDKL